jgi:integrase
VGAYLSGMIGCPALTKKEFNLALKNLRGRWRWRNRALLILGVRTGLRISELLSLRVGQVHDGQKILPRLYLNRQDSKGKRTGSSMVIHPRAGAALEKWIASPWGRPSRRIGFSRASATRASTCNATPGGTSSTKRSSPPV